MRISYITIMLWFCCAVAQAQTPYYVDQSVSSSGSGTSWATAKKTLQEALAIEELEGGDTILIAQGTYIPGSTVSATFELTSSHIGVHIMGGYRGGATNPGDRDIDAFSTILSGQLDGTNRARHVITAESIHNDFHTIPIIIDGVTITRGYA